MLHTYGTQRAPGMHSGDGDLVLLKRQEVSESSTDGNSSPWPSFARRTRPTPGAVSLPNSQRPLISIADYEQGRSTDV